MNKAKAGQPLDNSTSSTGDESSKADKVINNIIDNYIQLEKSVVNQLKMCNDLHAPTTGSAREEVWLQLFELIIPKKFVIEHSIFIIDSNRNISREVDLAIIDNNYTPYIFQYGRLKYVPIEAVAAVIECKSTRISSQEEDLERKKKESGLAAWCRSIENLRTSRESIARMATGTVIQGIADNGKDTLYTSSTQTSTRPIRILCGYKTEISTAVSKVVNGFFDFTLIAEDEGEENKIEIKVEDRGTLQDWYRELDHYPYKKKKEKDKSETPGSIVPADNTRLGDFKLSQYEVLRADRNISLLTFNFQLNQLLMIINNPILFPHLAYVNMFNGGTKKGGN